MDDIDVSKQIHLIEGIVSKHIDAKVEIVTDVATWCADNSGGMYKKEELDNPIGKSLWKSKTEPNRILLKKDISSNEVENHLQGLFMSGFRDVHYKIENSLEFLMHLVLHEVAHIKHDWDQSHEKDCDTWAFKQLELVKNKT